MIPSSPLLPSGLPFPEFEPGWVWLAGAGPGDPGLLTLHAWHALRHADVIVYDALVGPDILGLAREGCRLEFAGKARRQAVAQAARHLQPAGPTGPRRPARPPPERRRPVRLRTGRRGGADAGRAQHPLPRDPRHHRRDRRARLCRYSRHPPRHQPRRHLHDRAQRVGAGAGHDRLGRRRARLAGDRPLHGAEAPAHHRRQLHQRRPAG